MADHNLFPVLAAALLSSRDDKWKLSIVACSCNIFEGKDKEFSKKILDIFNESKSWPSVETFVSLGITSIPQIDFSSFTTADFIFHIDSLVSNSHKFKLTSGLIDLVKRSDDLSIGEIVSGIQTILPNDNQRSNLAVSLKDSYEIRENMPTGTLTFINSIDSATGGFMRSQTATVAGFVGSYKTTFGIHLLYSNCTKCKQSGVLISLEQTRQNLFSYVLARHSFDDKFSSLHTPVDKDKILKTSMSNDEKDFIFDSVEPDLNSSDYGKLSILDRTDFRDLSFSGITSRLTKLEDSIGQPIDFIIVDYIQKFRFIPEARDVKSLSHIVANDYVVFFNNLAMDFNGHPLSMILLAQVSRDGYEKAVESEGAYDIPALSELSSLDRESAFIMFLFSNSQLKDSGELKVNLPKNRYGNTFVDPVLTKVDHRYSIVGDMYSPSSGSPVDFTNLLFSSEGGSSFNL